MSTHDMTTRRRFLKQALSWSALSTMSSDLGALGPAGDRRSDPGAAHALILGDWGWLDVIGPDDLRGGEGFAAQTQVAAGMRHYVQTHNLRPDALFLLGDNWYGDLPGGAASPRWRTQFEEVYPAEIFPGPAYAMLGNHDYQRLPPTVDKVEAELAYARDGRGANGRPTRWTMPDRWYAFDFPAKQPHMRCLVLDSNMPRSGSPPAGSPDFTLTPAQQAAQLRWLEAELARPRTLPFLAVMAHHPVYSNGPHGDHPTLIRDWDPLFRRYNVDLYLAGHDHDLQVLQFYDHPTTHVLSGGGGADLYVLKIDDLSRGPYAQQAHGFTHLSVTGRELTFHHLDASGRPLIGLAKRPGEPARILPSSTPASSV